MTLLIYNGTIVNEGQVFRGSILIKDQHIADIFVSAPPESVLNNSLVIPAEGKYILPGIIDDQVHFREPGLEYKGDISTESKAAVAGGITSFMEMPNTVPQTVTNRLLESKLGLASEKSLANFSFYIGATNNNHEELAGIDKKITCGIKVFLGASTGNMLVDDPVALDKIFSLKNIPIAVHAEDESIIKRNMGCYKRQYKDDIPFKYHPLIRSRQACFSSSSFAVNLARKFQTRLHLLHLSTAEELSLLDNAVSAKDKQITGEVCIHHLWFCDADYDRLGSRIKWNPAIKTAEDRKELLAAVIDGRIDVIATDHAPHTLEEKSKPYLQCPSGGPLVQHSLPVMFELMLDGKITIEKIVDRMCHSPAEIFNIKNRGYLRKGYFADISIIDPDDSWVVSSDNILYKCNWSPLDGIKFRSKITHTIINGRIVFNNGQFDDSSRGMMLEFSR